MKNLLIAVLLGLFVANATMGATVTDATSSKNELYARGASPHVKFVDDGGDDYTLTVAGDVMRLENLDGNPFFNSPSDGTIGIEFPTPTGVIATPVAGGTLAPSTTYFFVVTALDLVGETVASAEATCLTTLTDLTCDIDWNATMPAASSYNVYYGTASGAENKRVGAVVNTLLLTADVGVSATPPEATTAFAAKLTSSGITFGDGTTQSTAGSAGAWAFFGSDIVNANSGNVGIVATGIPFVPDALLTVLGVVDINDMGALKALATNNMQVRSNYKNSTDRLWNTGQTSWAAVLGDSADRLRFYRAPATAGAPVYAAHFSMDATTFDLNIGPSAANRLNIDSGGTLSLFGNTATNFFSVNTGSQPNFRLDTATDVFEFIIVSGTLAEINMTGTSLAFTDFTNTLFEINTTAAASETNLRLLRNASLTPVRVSVEGVDTCGAGFRCLRVPN